jgi:hypothetical protein
MRNQTPEVVQEQAKTGSLERSGAQGENRSQFSEEGSLELVRPEERGATLSMFDDKTTHSKRLIA